MRTRRSRRERGQALVETAIIMPIMVFLILGCLQIILIEHGRVMTEYAAYNAARAGIVHNANWNVMRNAALISSLPLYRRTDDFPHFFVAWLLIKPVAELTEAVDTTVGTLERLAGDLIGIEISGLAQDISLIEVEVRNPKRPQFDRAARWQGDEEERARMIDPDKGELLYPEDNAEIDFDDARMVMDQQVGGPDLTRLAVEVRVLYPLKVPIINKIIFELWLAQELLWARKVQSDLQDWAQWRGRLPSGQYVDEAVAAIPGEGPLDDFFSTTQWMKELRSLRWVAETFGTYLIPIRATYAMQMQSNFFERNRREPVWFTIE